MIRFGHGFDENTEEKVIVTKLTEVMKANGLMDKVEDIFCFTDPAKIGVILFHNKGNITTFFRKMRQVDVHIAEDKTDDKTISWTTNDTYETRKREKILGYIKYHLNKKLQLPLKTIQIDRKNGMVKIKHRTVVKTNETDGDDLIYLGEALEVKSDVEKSMTDWLSKNSHDDNI